MASTAGSVNRWLILVTVMIGTLMSIMDATAVNITLPYIMTSFSASVQEVKWVTTVNMLTAAATMPLTGWLGRRIGFGRLYLVALSLFVVGATLCAISWSLATLISFRIIQAIGAGALQPTSMAILTRTFPPAERGRAIGIWGIGVMVGPTLGPIVGGVVTELFSWRAAFMVNLPTGVFMLMLASVTLPQERPEGSHPLDWRGYLAFVVFIVALLLTVSEGDEYGWGSAVIHLGWGLAVAGLLLFLHIEAGEANPMMPLRLFRSLDFALAMILSAFRSLSLFGTVFLVPLFLQRVQGRDAIDSGVMLAPGAAVLGVAMPLAGYMTDFLGGRWPTIIGIVAATYAIAAYGVIDPLTPAWYIVWGQLFRGIGVAFIMTPVTTAGMNAISREDAGYGSWMLNLAQRYGGAASIAVLSMALERQTSVQRDLRGTAPLLAGAADPELVHRARRLGLTRNEAVTEVMGLLRSHVSRAAATIAYQNVFIGAALVTFTGILPALLLSSEGRARRAAG